MLSRLSGPDTLDGTEFNLAEIGWRVRTIAATKFSRPDRFGTYTSWLDCLGETIAEIWDGAQERREFALTLKRRADTSEAQFFADEDAIAEQMQATLAALPQHQRTLEVQLCLAMDARDAVMRRIEIKKAA